MIRSAGRVEFIMGSFLDDLALGHHHDLIRPPDGGQLMRDRDGGSLQGDIIESLLHDLLRLWVQCTSCFIKDQDLGVRDDGTSDGDPLFLATGQHCRPFANLCVISLPQVRREMQIVVVKWIQKGR